MKTLALDLSKSCTGWCYWQPGWDAPRLGHQRLGGSEASNGYVFCRLQRMLAELHTMFGFERLVWEAKINAGNLQAATSAQTVSLMGGLDAATEMFAYAYGLQYRSINISSWRPDFLGREENSAIRAEVRAEEKRQGKKIRASKALKIATMERARQLGVTARKQDEADAFGVLDYDLLNGQFVTPPWRAAETLRAPLGGAS